MALRHGHRTAALIGLVAGLAVVSLAVTALAAGSIRGATSVSGSWRATAGEVVEQRQLGPSTYLRQRGASAFEGDLAGTTTFDLRLVLHPDFSSVGWATETFAGSFEGRAGTLSMLELAVGGADGSVRIDAVVLGGTGDLRGVRGTITFVSPLCIPETCEGTYTGTLHG